MVAEVTSDASDAAHLAAAMAAGDTLTWQSILDGITDLAAAKLLLVAACGLYVRHIGMICSRTGQSPVDWLNWCAAQQLEDALEAKANARDDE